MKKTKDSKFSIAAKIASCQVFDKWGSAWQFLGDDFRRAVVTERVFHVFSCRENPVTPDEMMGVLEAAFDLCGVH